MLHHHSDDVGIWNWKYVRLVRKVVVALMPTTGRGEAGRGFRFKMKGLRHVVAFLVLPNLFVIILLTTNEFCWLQI